MSKSRDSKQRETHPAPTGQERRRPDAHSSSGRLERTVQVPISLSTLAELSSSAQDRIAARAYQLWEANERPAGTDLADWFEAERILCTEG